MASESRMIFCMPTTSAALKNRRRRKTPEADGAMERAAAGFSISN